MGESSTKSILEDLTSRMTQMLNQTPIQPKSIDPDFKKWRTENAVVKGWLINSMDPSLIGNFIRFPTAKAIWDNIAITNFDGTDTSQVYDLKRQVMRLKQGGGSIETYYNNLQGLWREIDYRRPNPMKCEDDIQKYNSSLQEDRVYTFLDGLDDRLDKIRGDVLQIKPFPTVEQAYAHVRREDVRQAVMMAKGDTTSGAAMLSRGGHKSQQTSSLQILSGGKPNMTTKSKSHTEGGGCTHCGNVKLTRETCFKLHGYPEWWNELKAKKKHDVVAKENPGRAALVSTEPHLSLIPHGDSLTSTSEPTTLSDSGNNGCALFCSNQENYHGWIVDSGATDHMTFDPQDFVKPTQPKRTCIANANGLTYPVTEAGTVALSSSFPLPNTLLVPSLSSKLLSVGQEKETEEAEIGSEQSSPHPLVLEDQSPENTPKVQSLNSSLIDVIDDSVGYKLPFRQNRGKPPNRYSTDYEERTSKYPIANHVSTQRYVELVRDFKDVKTSIRSERVSNSKKKQESKDIMGLLSNKIDRQGLKPGDHIYCWRQVFIYAHHGIYVGDGKVIHFTQGPAGQENGRVIISLSLPDPKISNVPCPQCGDHNSSFNNGVILSCIDCFLFGNELNLFEYGVSRVYFLTKVRGGTCTLATSDPPEDILHHAYFLLKKGFGEYDVLKNNCEDFAIYCKTGLLVISRSSRGGQSGQAAALEATSGWIFSSLALLTNKFRGLAAVGSGVYYCYSRLTSDIGVRHDVAEVAVEAVEMVVGPPPPPVSAPSAPILE
ncbi:hypothetical protein EZV62_006774 [Acer yangbiense]|uniref:LRAT domain-containing protein n=1 Tax=Acer yangbiense TaxID=1000413 RepID=A0A5C7I9S2_9ROSI|nr:hypothetical protein EZV62_006774 [Acer yangbiense]